MSDDELELIRARRRLYEALDELEIMGAVRTQMLAEPVRALAVLDYARRARGVRSPAALAIARWRNPVRPLPPPEPELEAIPPTLDTLEYLWSRPPTLVGELVMKLIAAALERHGGYAALRESFHRHRTPST